MLDPRFFGLLLMVRKQLRRRGQDLRFIEVPSTITRVFRRNGFEFLFPTGSVVWKIPALQRSALGSNRLCRPSIIKRD